MFRLGSRSRKSLIGVHPDIRAVVERAIELTEVDFTVIEGRRTPERQAQLVKTGASKTLRSRHITGHAVDLMPLADDGSAAWGRCDEVAKAMLKAASELDIPLRWGGDWDMDGDSKDERFYDGPHFELLRSSYP